MITQEFNINIIPHGLPPKVPINQYDTGLRTLIAHVYQDDTEIPMTSAYTYTVVGTKPSGTGFSYSATVENGAIVFDVTGQMSVVAGPVRCGILIQNGDDVIGTLAFILDVQPAALTTGTIIDSDDFGTLLTAGIVDWMNENGASAIDDWLDEHPEATTSVQDGAISKVKLAQETKNYIQNRAIVNVADFANGALTSENLEDAVLSALTVSNMIYIPAGEYSTISGTTQALVTLTQDADIYLDANCKMTSVNGYPVFSASGCRFSLHGGVFYVGTDIFGDPDTDSRRYAFSNTGHRFIIEMVECTGGIIEGLTCTHSKFGATILMQDCENYDVVNCRFENMLMSAIRLLYHCVNIRIALCTFINSYIPYVPQTQPDQTIKNGVDYCYFVFTGAKSLSDDFVPPDNIIMENNYCYGSEDCGLDTHGATNVVFRNNRVLETVCAITAYNDNRRVKRPAGWVMSGVQVVNNWCVSSKDNKPGREYPHPFIFLGSANEHSDTEEEYADNPGTYDAFQNCVVEGNYIKSPNSIDSGLIYIMLMSRNISIRNNTIDCMSSGAPATRFYRCINFEFINNEIKNSAAITLSASIGHAENNTGARISNGTYFAYLTGNYGDFNMQAGTWMIKGKDMVLSSSGDVTICTNTYGLRPRSSSYYTDKRSYAISIKDGVCYCADPVFLVPGMAVSGIPGTSNYYISDVIDVNRFVVTTVQGALPADAESATMTIPNATTKTITNT